MRADQYSCGVIASLRRGRAALVGIRAHGRGDSPRERNAALNPAVDVVFDRLLARLPDERFRSVTDGYEALEAACEGRATQPVIAAAQALA